MHLSNLVLTVVNNTLVDARTGRLIAGGTAKGVVLASHFSTRPGCPTSPTRQRCTHLALDVRS